MTQKQLAEKVDEAASNNEFPIILGGDHSIVLGSLAGMSAACKKQGKTLYIYFKMDKKRAYLHREIRNRYAYGSFS